MSTETPNEGYQYARDKDGNILPQYVPTGKKIDFSDPAVIEHARERVKEFQERAKALVEAALSQGETTEQQTPTTSPETQTPTSS